MDHNKKNTMMERGLKKRWTMIAILATMAISLDASAGGGGQNMLLVVDPLDEHMVRIATAYAEARHIPDQNIVFYTPQSKNATGFNNRFLFQFQGDALNNHVSNAINDRGLTGQVDYIGTLFDAQRMYVDGSFGNQKSVSFGLSQLSNVANGLATIAGASSAFSSTKPLFQGVERNKTWNYQVGENNAIHHSQTYGTAQSQYYLAGEVGYTGQFGNTPDQVIAQIQRTAVADGTKPQGTVYFENNNDVRASTRVWEWAPVEAALTARGVHAVKEENSTTPSNKDDVRGATTGWAGPALPNGSTYLPGSWADNLTSYGMDFGLFAQTKATDFIGVGVGGTSGTVIEPFANHRRFPNAAIHVMIADGSTLGEAYAKSVLDPSVLTFLGDQLAQPYADLPDIMVTSAPADGAAVSGSVAINAAATLAANATLATGIKQMELWVDGQLMQTLAGDSANFNLDTTTLSDGHHALRVVAVNNAAAQSQSQDYRTFVVNNHGQSVAILTGDAVASDKQSFTVDVSAQANSGTLSRIELRSLGRTLSTLNANASGTVTIDPTALAYGDNTLIPVAIFSDGSEVAGETITVTRTPTYVAGATLTPQAQRTAGIKAEYFLGKGAATIADSDFTGTADITQLIDRLEVKNTGASGTELGQGFVALTHPTSQVHQLAARYSGHFEVAHNQVGEFQFVLFAIEDSTRLSIDGQTLMGYDGVAQSQTNGGDISQTIWLGEGEHDFELQVANLLIGTDDRFDVAVMMRGPDGVSRILNMYETNDPTDWKHPTNAFAVYQIPEPGGLALLGAMSVWMGLRRKASQK